MIRSLIKKALGMEPAAPPPPSSPSAPRPAAGAPHEAGMIQMGKKPGTAPQEGLPHRADGESVEDYVNKAIQGNDVLIFMKGTPSAPACGFSARVVDIFGQTGVRFQSVNVLEDYEVREGIKRLNNWPTIPQVFIKGEFVGGCDIVTQMAMSGDLVKMLKDKGVPS